MRPLGYLIVQLVLQILIHYYKYTIGCYYMHKHERRWLIEKVFSYQHHQLRQVSSHYEQIWQLIGQDLIYKNTPIK